MKRILLLSLLFFSFFLSFTYADYSREYQQAYTWAYNNWITTMDTIDIANLNWYVTRIELAKMMSNYAINVLKKSNNRSVKKFDDVSEDLDKKYDYWVSKSSYLWLMWQNVSNFRPYDNVSNAEFWTILSRLLRGSYHDRYSSTPYYEHHLDALKYTWIMPDITNPTWKFASRGDIMLMLRRSSFWGDFNLISKLYKSEWFKFIYPSNDDSKQTIKGNKILYVDDKYWLAIELWDEMNWWYLSYPKKFEHYYEAYGPFLEDEEIEQKIASAKPFDWEKIIDMYEYSPYIETTFWACTLYVYKKDPKNTSYCDYINNKYCMSFFCNDGLDIDLLYRHFNVFEVK